MKRLAFSWFVLLALFEASAAAQDAAAFNGKVKPFIKAFCIDCNGPDVKKAGLRLDILGTDLADEATLAKWVHAYDKIAAGKNTIRELVGTKVRVKEMLPEENSVAGFDNVSSALEFSPTHLLLFQETAEKAVHSAVPAHPNFKQTLTRSCKLDGHRGQVLRS